MQHPECALDADLDALVKSAASLFSFPMALISLVDRDRQWFKARVGLDLEETFRDLSFCAHAIVELQPLIITDASTDPRFISNKLVTGRPFMRFYVGAQLRTRKGLALGTLSVLDSVARQQADAQSIQRLRQVAVRVNELLEQGRQSFS